MVGVTEEGPLRWALKTGRVWTWTLGGVLAS